MGRRKEENTEKERKEEKEERERVLGRELSERERLADEEGCLPPPPWCCRDGEIIIGSWLLWKHHWRRNVDGETSMRYTLYLLISSGSSLEMVSISCLVCCDVPWIILWFLEDFSMILWRFSIICPLLNHMSHLALTFYILSYEFWIFVIFVSDCRTRRDLWLGIWFVIFDGIVDF